MKGGYQIVDLKGTNFTLSTAVTIAGVHSTIVNAHFKALLVENYEIGGNKQFATIPFVSLSGTTYTLDVGDYTITVTSTDSVTIAVKASDTTVTAQTLKTTKKAVTV